MVPFGFRCPRDLAAALDDSDQKHHDGADQQYVNESTHCEGADKSEYPEDKENDGNCV